MRFRFDTISFLLGAIVATVLWWVINLTWPILRQMISASREKKKDRALQASSGLEDAHRKIVYKQTQGTHLTASLFALDEIAIEPRLLAPPAVIEPNAPHPHQDIVEQALPYLPTYPEIGAVYGAPTLSIPEALSGGTNLVITGQPGVGKTTALAHLASQIVNRAPAVASLHEFIPFFIHVADLGLPLVNPQKPEDFLAPIAQKMSESAGVLNASKMPGFVQYAFSSGRALLLLDGVDELPQAAVAEVASYLRVLQRQYGKARVITTGAPEFVDGILALGYSPLALMPWNARQQSEFFEKWAALWQKYVAMESWAQATSPVDALLLNRWLAVDNFGLTPLELTLKTWAAYAGDARGARPVDAIEAHIRRLLPANTPLEALYVLGAQASLNGNTVFDSRRAREWTKAYEPVVAPQPAVVTDAAPAPVEDANTEAAAAEGEALPTPAATKNSPKKVTGPLPQAAAPSLISQLTNSGLLAQHGNGRVRFTHPVFFGFLAGKGLNPSSAAEVLRQPAWAGRTAAMRYMAAFNDATPLITSLLSAPDTVLQRPKLTAGRLLRDAPKNAPWRGQVLAALVQILQNEDAPLGLRGQALAAFATSGDPNAVALFRQLLMVPSNDLRQLAALGCGLFQDAKAVEGLSQVLSGAFGAARQAACLALVEIGSQPALEAVATGLLRGDEQLRIAAAEALANHPGDGHEALREGISSQDILMRRAIVYGLARIQEPWARELLEKTQIQDEQWVVRNVAVEIMDARNRANPHIPRRLSPPSETPWLIEFAGKFGMGVTPGQPATDIFLQAIKDENPDFRQAALNYLRLSPTEGVLSALYPHLYGDDHEMREAVFNVLAEMALGGISMPEPKQFGLG